VQFRPIPHSIFDAEAGEITANRLIIRLQPDEGVQMQVMIKDPGPGGMRLRQVPLDMSFADRLQGAKSGCLRAPDHGRHPRQPDPVHAPRRGRSRLGLGRPDPCGLGNAPRTTPKGYTAGTWGPSASIALVERDGRTWEEEDGSGNKKIDGLNR
jgi:glucose-6-phosphate 1-dehydrogenase